MVFGWVWVAGAPGDVGPYYLLFFLIKKKERTGREEFVGSTPHPVILFKILKTLSGD